jgi:phosphoribosyl 1,2-cyclic phosphodiesterase
MVEAGVKFSEVKKALDFDLSGMVGCLLSHEHSDHSKYAKDVMNAGINVYTSTGTMRGMKMDYGKTHRLHALFHKTLMMVGNFLIFPFDVKHDAKQPFGFLIKHPEMGTTLFLTDSFYVEYKFEGLNNILIEANYAEDILDANIEAGKLPDVVRNRVIQSHMELETVKELLKANDLKAVNNIVLLHLSSGNSHAERFKNEIAELTGKTVTVADSHMVINLNKTPF